MSVSTKPASGFRDFLPAVARRRERVFRLIRQVYESYGFEPLDTPCVERLDTLLGKYGEEGDQLVFKILQRGEKLERALELESPGEIDLADMGLRYDLTVPLARVYAQHRNALPKVFKRYQIAPVWRADRPQRGRFREFYQCDVDVVGATSMLAEAEVTAALSEVLGRLDFGGVRIHLNHRELLRALILASGIEVAQETDTLIAIDKLDKIGEKGVEGELVARGISEESVAKLLPLLTIEAKPLGEASEGYDNAGAIEALREAVGHLESGARALNELEELLRLAAGGPAARLLKLDPYLARGLSYYTGPIFEIRSDDFSGSLGGGGRYDGLIGMFGKQSVPACGFSLGVERILVLMEERGERGAEGSPVDVLVTVWDRSLAAQSVALAHELRAAGLRVDLTLEVEKVAKQMARANELGAPVVALLGSEEVAAGTVGLKVMASGEQHSVPRAQAAAKVRELLLA